MKKLLGTLAGLAISAFVAAAPAQAIIVDDFSQDQAELVVVAGDPDGVSGPVAVGSGTDLTNLMRTLTLADVQTDGGQFSGDEASVKIEGGLLVYSQEVGVQSKLTIDWTFDAEDFTGQTGIIVTARADGNAGGTLNLSLDGNDLGTLVLAAGVAQDYFFAIGAAGLKTGSQLIVDASNAAGLDVAIDIVQSVPEPAVLGLMGLGLLGMGAVARRRKAA